MGKQKKKEECRWFGPEGGERKGEGKEWEREKEKEFVEGEYLYKDLCENEGAGTL